MEEIKNNFLFPHSSLLQTPTTPHNFDQNQTPTLASNMDDHEMMLPQMFSSFYSGYWMNWINNAVLEQPAMKEESSLSLRTVNHNSLLANPNRNFETTQFYHPSTQLVDPNSNYNSNMDGAFLFSNPETTQLRFPSTLSTTHNKDSSNGSIGNNNGFLSDVVNFNSTKTTMTSENCHSFYSNLDNPALFPDPQTSHFCSPSTVSTTHDNGQFADSTRYTGLLSDVPAQMLSPNVPTMSLSTTNLLSSSSSSLQPQSPVWQNSSKIKQNSNNWSPREHKLFLAGMQLISKGEWKKIANYVVITKSHKQVASHAQKYFLRRETLKKHKRSSIHDITTVEPEIFALAEARLAQHMRRLNNKDQ